MTTQSTKIIHDLLKGIHPHEVARLNGCTRANAFKVRRELIDKGLIEEPKPVKSSERKSKHYDKIVEMHTSGIKPNVIATTLCVKPSTVYNQISEYNKRISKGVTHIKPEQWRCEAHGSSTCWWCWHKEVTGDYPKEPCLDYIYSNAI